MDGIYHPEGALKVLLRALSASHPTRGHSCCQLILLTARRIADFHRLVIAYVGRTKRMALQLFQCCKTTRHGAGNRT